tara:strand:- start:246 stop:716 length:471 start_codon:yes stop_codon:yes gene_type:complete
MKLRILTIISALLFTGCETCLVCADVIETYEYELQVGLELDSNGYYILPMMNSTNGQVLHKFTLDTNNPNENQFVWWDCESQYEMHIMDGWMEDVDIINHASYTGNDELAHTMFGPWVEMIGDTVTISFEYTDSWYKVYYHDQFQVILKDMTTDEE